MLCPPHSSSGYMTISMVGEHASVSRDQFNFPAVYCGKTKADGACVHSFLRVHTSQTLTARCSLLHLAVNCVKECTAVPLESVGNGPKYHKLYIMAD